LLAPSLLAIREFGVQTCDLATELPDLATELADLATELPAFESVFNVSLGIPPRIGKTREESQGKS